MKRVNIKWDKNKNISFEEDVNGTWHLYEDTLNPDSIDRNYICGIDPAKKHNIWERILIFLGIKNKSYASVTFKVDKSGNREIIKEN